jgi:hypothetical protein
VSTRERFVHLGYTVGRGEAVMLPIRHMVVTGQTQESGKTTTLEALIARADAGRGKDQPRFRAIAFITKRGEGAFATGHQLPPYFRTQKADWQYVSSLIDVTMGEKNKLLRSFLMKTCRNTKTLADVLVNVRAAKDSAKGFPESIYTEIEGYLELVVPQLAQLPPAHKLTLKAGLNVMDVSAYTTELQALVLRAVLDHVQDHEEDVVVVVPEAWEFLPEGRGSPVKAAAERLVRQGAGLGNYLWIDSQDLGGVWKTVVRACPVALVGVQREANEIKRTLANIHTPVKPKAVDVAGLERGEFYACWGKHAEKTYVQPAGMEHLPARAIARGEQARTVWRPPTPARRTGLPADPTLRPLNRGGAPAPSVMEPVGSILKRVTAAPAEPIGVLQDFVDRGRRAQARAEHLIFHGPGLTFGELAIGERFWWAAPVPRGPEPMRKRSATTYGWTKGGGEAEDYYRVERAKGGEGFMSDQAEQKLDQLLERFDGFVKMMHDKYGAGTARVGAPTVVLDDPEGAQLRLGERSDRELTSFADQVASLVLERLHQLAQDGDARVGVILSVLQSQPELRVKVQQRTIEASDEDLTGRLGLLIADGHFDAPTTAYSAFMEIGKRGWSHDRRTVERAVAKFAEQGFLRKGSDGYVIAPGLKHKGGVLKVSA